MTDTQEVKPCCGCPIGTCSGEASIYSCHKYMNSETEKYLHARIEELEGALRSVVNGIGYDQTSMLKTLNQARSVLGVLEK